MMMAFPLNPKRLFMILRQVMDPEDIVISDVGAHKMWMARHYHSDCPNTCIISNGFAAMGIAIPGALAAKLVYPERNSCRCDRRWWFYDELSGVGNCLTN